LLFVERMKSRGGLERRAKLRALLLTGGGAQRASSCLDGALNRQ
jgi:hypothetical protein